MLKTRLEKGIIICVVIVALAILCIWYVLKKEAKIVNNEFDRSEAFNNYQNFSSQIEYSLYRQGNPEQVLYAVNKDLPFSKINYSTEVLCFDSTFSDIEDCLNICFDCPQYSIVYKNEEIDLVDSNDNVSVAFYFVGSNDIDNSAYPNANLVNIAQCENITVAIFRINNNLLCTAVGSNLTIEDFISIIASATKNS